MLENWRPIDTAPKDGTEFMMWGFSGDWDKHGFWVPCAKFETPRSIVPSVYLYESRKWVKFRRGVYRYWAVAVKGPQGQHQLGNDDN